MTPDRFEIRDRLSRARVLLLFTPELCGSRDPLAVLAAAAPFVDVVQVRPKSVGGLQRGPCEARATFEWARRVLALEAVREFGILVTVDDRVDVASVLWSEGLAGVHVGEDDMPVAAARAFLGDGPLIGLSTHDFDAVLEAEEGPADYLGFGPVHATSTKGYSNGLGSDACWIASEAAAKPLFPIGGISSDNAGELARVGRAAVGSAILGAADPRAAAQAIRAALEAHDD